MRQEGKYRPLFDYLLAQGASDLTLTLREIEAVLNAPLPPSARVYRGWWSNRDRGSLQAAAWIEAGYQVRLADLVEGRVTFEKIRRKYEVNRVGDIIQWDGDLVRALRDHMGVSQAELAEKLGVRQQTISEWEKGAYLPTRATSRFLALVAERAGFTYGDDQPKGEVSKDNSS